MRIGVTDTFTGDLYEQYIEWLRVVDGALKIKKFSYKLNNARDIVNIDGLLLTGGGDVHPKFYEKEQEICKATGIDEQRDVFEFGLIDCALEAEMPVLGICRGMQTINVFLGGSLVVDLISSGFNNHTNPTSNITKHKLSVVPHSMLHALTGETEIEVNSYHHQAVERLGQGLVASAFAPDGVIEAAEWAIKDRMPFLMTVQWHPERTKEEELSKKLAHIFLREVHQYHHQITVHSY